MRQAISIYTGKLFDASSSDHGCSRQHGLICPLCKEAVFLRSGYIRSNANVSATWVHYKTTVETKECEARSLTAEAKMIVRQLQPKAQGQRLLLFNRRFWDIFKFQKDIPASLNLISTKIVGSEAMLDKIVEHCRNKWDVEAINLTIPRLIKYMKSPSLGADLSWHSSAKNRTPEEIDALVKDIGKDFSLLRYKILLEVVAWLPTSTAKHSWKKLIQLAITDATEVTSPPFHTETIAHLALMNLVLTDWELAIKSLENPTQGIGFK